MRKFQLIHGGENSKPSRVKDAVMLCCPKCEGREVIETKTGVLRKNGKPYGGTKQLICAACQRKGERVVIA